MTDLSATPEAQTLQREPLATDEPESVVVLTDGTTQERSARKQRVRQCNPIPVPYQTHTKPIPVGAPAVD